MIKYMVADFQRSLAHSGIYLEPKPLGAYPWYLRALFRYQQKKFGQALIPQLLWGYHPVLCLLFAGFFVFLTRKKSELSGRLRTLVMTRIAQLCWCRFCIDINSLFLVQETQSDQAVLALEKWRESAEFSMQEKLALEYAEAVTATPPTVSSELFHRLNLNFSKEAIVELTAMISYQNLSARFNAALNIPSQGLCQVRK